MSSVSRDRPRRGSDPARPSTAGATRERPRSPMNPAFAAASAAQALRRLVDDGGSSDEGEEVEYLSSARPAIEPIDQPDSEVEEKILAFFHFEKHLESYYWNCSNLKDKLAAILQGIKQLVDKTRLLSKPTDTGVNRIVAYSLKLEDTLQLFNRDFKQTFESQCLLPIGQAKSGFGEIKHLIHERDQIRLEVHHYQRKVATLGAGGQNKKTLRNYDKMRTSFGNLENATTNVLARLAKVDELRKQITRTQICELFKIMQDILHMIAGDIQTATNTEPSTGEAGHWYDRDTADYPSAAIVPPVADTPEGGDALSPRETTIAVGGVVLPKNFVLQHFMKHRGLPKIDHLLVSDKAFMQAARIFEECEGGFPVYRDCLLQIREATTGFFQTAVGIIEDVKAMLQPSEVGDNVHVTNYYTVFQTVLTKLNREVGPMYESRFLRPVDTEMEQFPATKQRIQQRLEDLIEHHHYWTKLESMAKNIHKNPEEKTVRNQHKLKQLHETLRTETSALVVKFEEMDALRHTIVMFHLSEFLDIETTVLQDAVAEMKKARDQWRKKRLMAASNVKSSTSDADGAPRSQISPRPSTAVSLRERFPSRSQEDSDDELRGVFSPMVTGQTDDFLESLTRTGRARSPRPVAPGAGLRSRSPSPVGRPVVREPPPAGRSRGPSDADSVTRSDASSTPQYSPRNSGPMLTKPRQQRAAQPIISPPANVFANMVGGTGQTIPLSALFEEYEATIYESGPLGMRMVKIKEISAFTGSTIEWGQIQMVGPESLAGKAGIEAGSILIEVNGQSTVGIPQQDLMELIKAAPRPLRMRFVLSKHVNPTTESRTTSVETGNGKASVQTSSATNSSVLGGEILEDLRIAMHIDPPRGAPPMSPDPPTPGSGRGSGSTNSVTSGNGRRPVRAGPGQMGPPSQPSPRQPQNRSQAQAAAKSRPERRPRPQRSSK